MSAILEYQKAVYARLQADSALVASVQGIYDSVPQNAVIPYVYFGDVASDNADSLAKKSFRINFKIICVSETLGKKQVAEIAEKIRVLMHQTNLTVVGYTHINTSFIEQKISLANNGMNYFAELSFEAVITT